MKVIWKKFHPLSAACVGMTEEIEGNRLKELLDGGYVEKFTGTETAENEPQKTEKAVVK